MDVRDAFQIPMLIGGRWQFASRHVEHRNPYTGEIVALVPDSTRQDVAAATLAAAEAAAAAAAMPSLERARLLRATASLLRDRAEDLATLMAVETGKAWRDALAEVERGPITLELAAEEAVRITGEHVPLDASPMGSGKIALSLRFPVGVVAAITPYNAPVNLSCHKVAPALAAGNTVVLKPSPQSSLVIHRLVEIFVEAGWPAGFLNVVYGNEAGESLVNDQRVQFISFTGSSAVGARISAAAGLRRVALELGGSGANIVDEDIDVSEVAALCARNAMRLAGQSCVSVQNVYVHEAIAQEFTERTLLTVAALTVGDPLDRTTDVGTLIDERAAVRVESWIGEAEAAGARRLFGGSRQGAQLQPTVMSNLNPTMRLVCDEVFGPVLNIIPVVGMGEAFKLANASQYGLQAGLFTRSLDQAIAAVRQLRVGGLIVNGTSTWRADQMPYGGVKNSGIGREGPAYAIRDMTEERLVVFNL